ALSDNLIRVIEDYGKPLSGSPSFASASSTKLSIGTRSSPCYRMRSFLNREVGSITLEFIMSQHRSLRAVATMGGKRNVLKRFERVELLKKRGQWKAGDRVTGLRKTKPEA